MRGASRESLQRAIEVYDLNRPLAHIPKIELVSGDLCETLPEYVADNPHLVVSLLHLDLDIYEPTKVALEVLLPRLPKGAVICFDEVNHGHWPGETIAVMETVGISQLRLQRFPFCPNISYAIIGA